MILRMRKYVLSAAAFLLLPVLHTAAAVKVSEGKIVLGTTFQFPISAPAEFECRITNPDSKLHRITVRLSPAESYGAGVNSCSPEIIVPPHTRMLCRLPFFPGSEEKYTFTVFEDGVRQAGSTANECSIKLLEHRQKAVGFLNDLGDVPGGFKKNPFLIYQLVPVNFRTGSLPESSELYRALHALILIQPDFSGYTAEQFNAIRQYVADGGLLIFADPEGALAAASTPLAELLPVVPLGLRLMPAPLGLLDGKKKPSADPSPREIKFLNTVEKKESPAGLFSDLSGFPLLREKRYGLGTVRFLAFSPIQENFPEDSRLADYFIALLLSGPDRQQSFSAFREPLDQLTGFTVPRTASIRNILIFYFALLLVILILGFRTKRHASAWQACTLTAVIMTVMILIYANRTLGKRGALAAILRVENAQTPGAGRNYLSLYAPEAVRIEVKPEGPLSLFEQLPFRRYLGMMQGEAALKSPLDLRTLPDQSMEIREINLAARSSRQIMEHLSPSGSISPKLNWKPPRLLLNGKGIRLEPWKIPDASAAEAAFVLFPNGSKPAEITPSGLCLMKDHDSAIADPLVENLRTAMEKSHSKKRAAVVIVSGGKIDHPGLDKNFLRQGKTLTVYPAELEVESPNILLPGEMLAITPAEISSRMALDGGKINSKYQLQQGMLIALNLFRPDALEFPAVFSALKVKVTISGNDQIEPSLKLFAGPQAIPGKKTGDGEFLFAGKEISQLFADAKPIKLTIEGTRKKNRSQDMEYKPGNWSLLDLKLELRGKTGTNHQEKQL